MKRITFPLLLLSFFWISCSSNEQTSGQTESDEPITFFPVHRFFQGELYEIKSKGIGPLYKTSIRGKTDSVWLRHEQLDSAFADFLQPAIDSATLSPYFKETSFLDATINAFTLDSEPRNTTIPDSIPWKKWSVYIDPVSQKVKRVYLTKRAGEEKEWQLTWNAGRSCKILLINKATGAAEPIERETTITWDF